VNGGVGNMNVDMIMKKNVMYDKREDDRIKNNDWKLRILKMKVEVKVNRKIKIERKKEEKDVNKMEEEIGLYKSEVFKYGKKKEKIEI
jgi:hypothetical protein